MPENDEWNGALYSFKDEKGIKSNDADSPIGIYSLNEWISGSNYRFRVVLNQLNLEESEILFGFNSYKNIAKRNLKSIEISPRRTRFNNTYYFSTRQ